MFIVTTMNEIIELEDEEGAAKFIKKFKSDKKNKGKYIEMFDVIERFTETRLVYKTMDGEISKIGNSVTCFNTDS
jgi:hypothetical protein